MVTYEGSHGTTKERAKNILSFGFRIRGARHRYGAGVYFWKKSHHYINLAIGWHKYAEKTGLYRYDKNTSCTVIIADLVAEENEVLDLEDALLKDKIAKLAEEKNINEDWKAISSLVEAFVQLIQAELKIKYKIVLKKATPPPKDCCPKYPYNLLGWPDCCIVKDVTCIELKR
jgi:hypothetical protein